jgi:hypothetical protein
MVDYSVLIKLAITFAAITVIICRLDKMTEKTRRAVRYQHVVLCASLIFSLSLPAAWSNSILCLGVLVYFCYSKKRWSDGPPIDTTRPIFLKDLQWPKISGPVND